MKTILFQGDSITDAQRIKEDPDHMGSGYAIMVAGELGLCEPGKYRFINRGVSGNKSTDVLARMKEDIIDIKPDYMSLMIGVNDVWHELDLHCGCDEAAYAESLTKIVEGTLNACPGVKIIMLEPYILEEYNTRATEDFPDKWEKFKSEVAKRSAIAREISEKYSLKFVSLQDILDKACEATGVAYWASDGVHPTPMGHCLIAREWIKAFKEIEDK